MAVQRLRRMLCVVLVTGMIVPASQSVAREVQSHRHKTGQSVDGTASRLFIVDMGTDRPHASAADQFLVKDCRDCDFENPSARQFMPGDTTLKFRPVGGTFSYHF